MACARVPAFAVLAVLQHRRLGVFARATAMADSIDIYGRQSGSEEREDGKTEERGRER